MRLTACTEYVEGEEDEVYEVEELEEEEEGEEGEEGDVEEVPDGDSEGIVSHLPPTPIFPKRGEKTAEKGRKGKDCLLAPRRNALSNRRCFSSPFSM